MSEVLYSHATRLNRIAFGSKQFQTPYNRNSPGIRANRRLNEAR